MDFEHYDEELAGYMLQGGFEGRQGGGLPDYLGIRTTGVGPGWVESEVDVRDELLNPFGAAHGGVLSALVDHLLGSCVFPVVPRGTWPATQEFKLSFLAPVRPGVLAGRAEVLSLRPSSAVVRIDARNHDRLVGTALGTVSLKPPRPA
jgi:uncharacterized protein (TIGR00369 family)